MANSEDNGDPRPITNQDGGKSPNGGLGQGGSGGDHPKVEVIPFTFDAAKVSQKPSVKVNGDEPQQSDKGSGERPPRPSNNRQRNRRRPTSSQVENNKPASELENIAKPNDDAVEGPQSGAPTRGGQQRNRRRGPSDGQRSGESPAAGVSNTEVSAEGEGQRQIAGNQARRRRPVRSRAEGEIDPVRLSIETKLASETKSDSRQNRRANQRIGRTRNGRPLGRYLMSVHKTEKTVQIAVSEGRTLMEMYVSRVGADPNEIDGNIYLGRVTNVLAGMEAAFVDIGTSKNAVLYRGDVRFDRDDLSESSMRDIRIENLLRPRQVVMCQVTKNPIGTKGARLTQEVSLPGRFVVLVPNADSYGISKRLPDDERKRLRRILGELKPEGFGVIVRTAAEGASADELERDITQLVEMWKAIEAKAKSSHAPTLLYSEPDVAVRVIREEFNRNYRGVVIDDREIFEEVHSYVSSITPELADRVEFYDTESKGMPIFEAHMVHEQLHKALERKVWLPSGGYLIIDRAEALTVIDVNTGRNIGTVSLEETIHQTNVEAADEIARQLRLRDIGGIIIIDFIDMTIEANKEDVLRALRSALARDKTKTQVYDISSLGLVEMTRQRISEGMVEALSETCPVCKGRGLLYKDVEDN
ncbi:MAG: Rne/Rng family ribonuclease [Actinomycetota bacterium]|nr:Rne/Rng family ribonuclease [Actinomycetota bacterium]